MAEIGEDGYRTIPDGPRLDQMRRRGAGAIEPSAGRLCLAMLNLMWPCNEFDRSMFLVALAPAAAEFNAASP